MNSKEAPITRRRMLQVSGATVAVGLMGTSAQCKASGLHGPERERLMANNQSTPKPTSCWFTGRSPTRPASTTS